MSQGRRTTVVAATMVAAAVVVVVGLVAWQQNSPQLSPSVALTLAGAFGFALVGGAFVRDETTRSAMPLMAGIILAILGIDNPEHLACVLPLWSAGVVVGYRLLAGPFAASLPRACQVIVSGGVLTLVTPYVDLDRAPYDRVLVGLIVFVFTQACLEWLARTGERRIFGPRTWFLASVGIIYAAGLVLVQQQLLSADDHPWRAVAVGALVGLGGLAVVQYARITVLQRMTHALTEAATTTPWPADQIDSTLIRLVDSHVRAASITVGTEWGGPSTLTEQIQPGSVLVVRREPGDFSFSRYDARLVAGLAAMARASHAQSARETKLWTAAVTDELTGLWEYDHWRSHLREQSKNRAGGEKIGVVFLDLDHFKQVNSDYGHLRADVLLTTVGHRLLAETRWRFGRFGGDEFVGIARNIRDEAHLDELCRRLAAVIRAPVDTGDQVIAVTASIGRVVSVNRGESADVILARAEQDLRALKAARNAPAQPVVEVPEEDILTRLLDQGVEVAYQPIVDMTTRSVVGWEALLRGNLPLVGDLSPERLVGTAVRVGVMDLVTRQVATQAIAVSLQAAAKLGRPVVLNINLELEQFHADSSLLKWLIEESRRDELTLVLELTERGSFGEWSETEDALARHLGEQGIGIALDDLGAGSTRLPLLLRTEWHAVKLDRSFLLGGARGEVLLARTVAMLHELGMRVVMEGVETTEQLALIQRLKIDAVQGHLFSPAMSGPQLLDFVMHQEAPAR